VAVHLALRMVVCFPPEFHIFSRFHVTIQDAILVSEETRK
jgi:hypothetical protein